MINDSNSKKDLSINSQKKATSNKLYRWFACIISIITILNIVILAFIILNYQGLLDKFHIFNNANVKSPTYNKNVVKNEDMKLSKHFSEHEYFKTNITKIWDKIDELNKELKTRVEDYKSLENRILNENQYTWILNEADYVISLIATQIILNGNIHSAIESLQILDERLSVFRYPEIINLRKSIGQDLSKIIQKNYVDIASVSLEIDFIANIIDSLPSYSDAVLNNKTDKASSNKESSNILTWYGDIWDDIKNGAANLVKVRKIKGDGTQFVLPEQIFFIRENIKLKLQDARIALIYRNQDIYINDLNSVKDYLNKYFDNKSKVVQDTNKKLSHLLELDLKLPELTDLLGNTLGAIRNLRSLNYNKNYGGGKLIKQDLSVTNIENVNNNDNKDNSNSILNNNSSLNINDNKDTIQTKEISSNSSKEDIQFEKQDTQKTTSKGKVRRRRSKKIYYNLPQKKDLNNLNNVQNTGD